MSFHPPSASKFEMQKSAGGHVCLLHPRIYPAPPEHRQGSLRKVERQKKRNEDSDNRKPRRRARKWQTYSLPLATRATRFIFKVKFIHKRLPVGTFSGLYLCIGRCSSICHSFGECATARARLAAFEMERLTGWIIARSCGFDRNEDGYWIRQMLALGGDRWSGLRC